VQRILHAGGGAGATGGVGRRRGPGSPILRRQPSLIGLSPAQVGPFLFTYSCSYSESFSCSTYYLCIHRREIGQSTGIGRSPRRRRTRSIDGGRLAGLEKSGLQGL
jgi:hypothetical protein